MMDAFDAARRASVPIILVRSADQVDTVEVICRRQQQYPLFQWDAAMGISGLNDAAARVLKSQQVTGPNTVDFLAALLAARDLPQGAILFCLNAHLQLSGADPVGVAGAIQGVSNMRDRYKRNMRTLVLLGPSFPSRPELEQDVMAFDHELPGPEKLRSIVDELHATAKPQMTPEAVAAMPEMAAKATEAVSGLSAFAAEQVISVSISRNGIDLANLWERKRIAIEQSRGLSVYRGGDTFGDLRGLENIKAKLRARRDAKSGVGVVVWIDEGADVFANVEQDTSGNKTDQSRALQVEMENNGWSGAIFTGVAGTGKSALARAFGNEAGVPTIALDFGDMESKWVGDSEANLRQAIRTIKAVGQGRAFFILTCNSLQGIRPQLMRRFKKGVYFFDTLSDEERAPIWDLYLRKYGLDARQQRPDDTGWNGAEIRECCEEAWDTGTTLLQAAQFIIPVTRSRADVIDEMRRNAHGRFLDASRPGTYQYTVAPMEKQKRALTLPDDVALAVTLAATAGRKES